MYTPRDLNYEPLYAVATFLSPLQCNDLSEPEKKIARDYLKAEVQKLEDYMGEEAIETNDKIGGVEDHEKVYIPGAGHLGKLNNRNLRRLNQEADFDTRYIMLCYQVSVLLYFHQITDLGKTWKGTRRTLLRLWPSCRPAGRSRSLVTRSSAGSWSAASALQNLPTLPVTPNSTSTE